MPEEWERLPAMAVEVELDLELEDSKKLNDPDLLTFLMDEAIQTFNSRGRYSWVGSRIFMIFCYCLKILGECVPD